MSGNERYQGFCADLAAQLAARLRINYRLRPVKDEKYGEQLDNGSWNGMVGELIRKVSHSILYCLHAHYYYCYLDDDDDDLLY